MNKITSVIAIDAEGIAKAQKLRRLVFGNEQGFSTELDVDGKDQKSIHILLYVENESEPIASGRLTIENDVGILSRIAVMPDHRGAGIGKRVVMELEKVAAEKRVKKLSLDPHDYLEKFYANLGYEKVMGDKLVANYHLITMTKSL